MWIWIGVTGFVVFLAVGLAIFLKRRGSKLRIIEYAYDPESEGIYVRGIGETSARYDPERDMYYCFYKNTKIPVKHNYIRNGIFSVLNYENSFVPLWVLGFEIKDVDLIGETSKQFEKLKKEISGSDIAKEIEKLKKMGFDKIAQELSDEVVIDPEKKKKKGSVDKILKMCAIPMEIRTWYILNLKRLVAKHMGFWTKWGNIILIVLFMTFTVAIVYVAFDMGGQNAIALAKEGSKIFDRIQILAVKNKSFVPVERIATTMSPP